jgi:hypothetical protein
MYLLHPIPQRKCMNTAHILEKLLYTWLVGHRFSVNCSIKYSQYFRFNFYTCTLDTPIVYKKFEYLSNPYNGFNHSVILIILPPYTAYIVFHFENILSLLFSSYPCFLHSSYPCNGGCGYHANLANNLWTT